MQTQTATTMTAAKATTTKTSKATLAEAAALYSGMTTKQLKTELGKLLGITANNLYRVAVIASELERRGHATVGWGLGLMPYLRFISQGTLLAEAVVAFMGSPGVLGQVAQMSLKDQAAHVADHGARLTARGTPKGRKATPDSGLIHLAFSLSQEDAEKVRVAAGEADQSVSSYMRSILVDAGVI